MNRNPKGPRGRGALQNPPGRFERLEVVSEEPLPGRVATRFLRDDSRSIVTRNESPDVPFEVSINPYRGCEHGCTYCYARTYHEYLGFSAGLDFETRILVKEIFRTWLEQTFPERSSKVLNRVRSLRGGALSDSQFGRRMRGEGVFADQSRSLFHTACERHGLRSTPTRLSTAAFRRPGGHQLDLPGEMI